jgi:hypothetical protein
MIIQSDRQCERLMVRLASRLKDLVRFPQQPTCSAALDAIAVYNSETQLLTQPANNVAASDWKHCFSRRGRQSCPPPHDLPIDRRTMFSLYFSPEASTIPEVFTTYATGEKNMANKKIRKVGAAAKARPKAKARKNLKTATNQPLPKSVVSQNRSKGLRMFKLAGRPTTEQFVLVYGENGPKMTWGQRAAAGVPAKKFQDALAAKQAGR